MGVTEDFARLLRAGVEEKRYRELFLPELLTLICTETLAVDGASLSLLSGQLRMPLAASDGCARAAELVQFTLGDGPCLDTYRTGRPTFLGQAQLTTHWPLYLDALTATTPYRSVASLPLELGSGVLGGLELYRNDPEPLPETVRADALGVADLVARTLSVSTHVEPGAPAQTWLDNPATRSRAMSWIAIGVITRTSGLSSQEALDIIRDHAVRLGQTVDAVSRELATNAVLADLVLAEVRPD